MKLQSFNTWKRNNNLKGRCYALIAQAGFQKIGREFTYTAGYNESPKDIVGEYLADAGYNEEAGEFLYLITRCNVYEDSKIIEIFYKDNH